MRTLTIVAIVAALSGCAIHRTPDELAYAPEPDLCYLAASPESSSVTKQSAWQVIQQRRVNCAQWNQLVAQRMAQDRAATVQMVNSFTAPPAQPAPARNCTSRVVGSTVQTTCY